MKKKLVMSSVFLLLVCSGFVFVGAASSSSETDFDLTFIDECIVDEYNNYFYYDEDGDKNNPFKVGPWCTMGDDPYMAPGCCPSGFVCSQVEGGGNDEYKCGVSSKACDTNLPKDECEAGDYFYYDGTCWCDLEGFKCGDYTNENDCKDDVVGGVSGYSGPIDCIKTEVECKGKEFIPFECKCVWVDGSCGLSTSYSQDFYEIGSVPITWDCFKEFEFEECIDGKQEFNWTAEAVNVEDPEDVVDEVCLKSATCVDGTDSRFCGEALVKLPGFSLFSLIVSLFVIGVYYLLIGRFKYSEGFE